MAAYMIQARSGQAALLGLADAHVWQAVGSGAARTRTTEPRRRCAASAATCVECAAHCSLPATRHLLSLRAGGGPPVGTAAERRPGAAARGRTRRQPRQQPAQLAAPQRGGGAAVACAASKQVIDRLPLSLPLFADPSQGSPFSHTSPHHCHCNLHTMTCPPGRANTVSHAAVVKPALPPLLLVPAQSCCNLVRLQAPLQMRGKDRRAAACRCSGRASELA